MQKSYIQYIIDLISSNHEIIGLCAFVASVVFYMVYMYFYATVKSAYDQQTIAFFNKTNNPLVLNKDGNILKRQPQNITINLQNYKLHEIHKTLTPGINYGKVTITGFHSPKGGHAIGRDMAERMKCFERLINAFGTMNVTELEIVGFLYQKSKQYSKFDYNQAVNRMLEGLKTTPRILNTPRLTLTNLPESFLTQIVQAYRIPQRFSLTVRGSDAPSFAFLDRLVSIQNMQSLELTSFWALKEVGSNQLHCGLHLGTLTITEIPNEVTVSFDPLCGIVKNVKTGICFPTNLLTSLLTTQITYKYLPWMPLVTVKGGPTHPSLEYIIEGEKTRKREELRRDSEERLQQQQLAWQMQRSIRQQQQELVWQVQNSAWKEQVRVREEQKRVWEDFERSQEQHQQELAWQVQKRAWEQQERTWQAQQRVRQQQERAQEEQRRVWQQQERARK
ncbi:hypothetical protein NEDG_00916 [Nematocida displodere]|uniref:Uncharacterized protein n=1 Tax=Nematocida displodere TaxID=1805483 RepID=A0A177EA16_9MICR|nr:hypothetical protein NEDG_00916 [Nematocida displodere]